MSIANTRRKCDSRGFDTSTGAGAKDGIVGWINAGNEGNGEGKKGRIVSGAMDRAVKRYYFFNQPMY